ncbi:hypothetical protein C8A01DRAFT_33865 [Parachaetomium inaequale]|uniref:HMG box domain-containing protein n=1 Tax=Parachaetomium inaequale TaxID=2588326 RepID=A0AAN6PJM2_9PEZI|nr:hypothetical protein C8A01DRAFT_33865 [Parachaetomium inaequale]
MLSAIGRATARQARVAGRAGRLSSRSASRLTAQLTPRAAPVIPSGIRVAAVFARGFAEAGAPKKTTKTATKTAAKKKPAAKKPAKKAAAKKKTATKKAAKPKAAVAKKAAKPKKAPLTEEEQARIKIRALKKTALLKEEPVKLPVASWTTFVSKNMKRAMDRNPSPTFTEAVRELSDEFKALPDAEKEKLEVERKENSVANEVTMRNWVDSYTPQQIRQANLARMQLRRKYNVGLKLISDPRFPKSVLTGYMAYMKSRINDPEFAGLDGQARIVKISPGWKQLSAEERKRFEEIAETDLARYNKEMAAYQELDAQK